MPLHPQATNVRRPVTPPVAPDVILFIALTIGAPAAPRRFATQHPQTLWPERTGGSDIQRLDSGGLRQSCGAQTTRPTAVGARRQAVADAPGTMHRRDRPQ
jgi:hypothetical protein